jgi:hypothetical protein
VHDWPYWRQYLRDALAWGFFKPVVWHPKTWTFKTVMRHSSAWGYSIAFSSPPSAVETFSYAGGRLSASGSGRATVRGPGRCRLVAKLPFKSRRCRRPA